MPASPPYFFSEALKTRFALDIQEAIESLRITPQEGDWLQSLLDETAVSVRPVVNRLVMDDGSVLGDELTAALLISDPSAPQGAVFLSTLLVGIERFDDRAALLHNLKQRYDEAAAASVIVDAERLEMPVFTERMRAVMRQQAAHLENLSRQLQQIPDLRAAAGKAFQASLAQLLPETHVDVSTHMLQIVDEDRLADSGSSPVVGTQRLVDAALDQYVAQPLPQSLKKQFLDSQGQWLPDDQAQLYTQALTRSVELVSTAFEQLLGDYWACVRPDGRSVRQFAADALAVSFRQHLLAGRSSGALSEVEYRRLRRLLTYAGVSAGQEVIMVRRMSVSVGGQEPVKLVGAMLIEIQADDSSSVYLYSPLHGFRTFAHFGQLAEQFSTPQGREELLVFTSLNDHALLRSPGDVELRMNVITASLFDDCLESIIALQKRNARYVLDLAPIGHERTPVRVDDALDIRALLDGRLSGLHEPARWRSEPVAFAQAWDVLESAPVFSTQSPKTWTGKLSRLEVLNERVTAMHLGVDGCMRNAFNFYLALLQRQHLDARALWIVPTVEGAEPVSLIAWAIERLDGNLHRPVFDETVVQGLLAPVAGQAVPGLPRVLLEEMLTCVLADFSQRYERQNQAFYACPVRHLDSQFWPGDTSSLIRAYALRLELLIERRLDRLPAHAMDSLQQVLDRPMPALRQVLGERCIDAYSLTLEHDPLERALVLPNAFVLREAGSSDRILMWTLGHGLECFDSMQVLQGRVVQQAGDGKPPLALALLAAPDRQALQDAFDRAGSDQVKVVLHRMDGHFCETLQRLEANRQCRTVAGLYEQSVRWSLPVDLFRHLLSAAERDDRNRQILNGLGFAIQAIIYKAIVPEWVSEASLTDQASLVEILQRFYVSCVAREDFLFGVPSLYDYSRERLIARLNQDFPGQNLDPDNVVVTLTHYIPAPVPVGQLPQGLTAASDHIRESLTEFAASRFMSRQDGVISLTTRDEQPLDVSFTPLYLRAMIDALDVSAGYRALLTSTLDPDAPSYAKRRRLFAEQMPALDLLRAYTLKLKHELSSDAWHFIEGVLNMPDGIARLPVQGCKVVLSPLRLVPAKEGWEPTRVLNTYLIGPEHTRSGPWVLYSLMHQDFVFKEYVNQEALLKDIRTSASLQSFILERIDPAMRKVYDKGGFAEPHLPFSVESSFDFPWEHPQPVTVDIQPYEGNALDHMFSGALESLKQQVRKQSVTSAEFKIKTSQYLFGLGIEQVMALLPGRLGALVGVWQSHALFSSSIASAGEQRWGKAVSQFLAAVSMLVASAQRPPVEALEDPATSATQEGADERLEPEALTPYETFSWSNNSRDQQVWARLRQFEVHDVALNTLRKDELNNTYNDPVTGRTYAAIEGKAFELESDRDGWFIVSMDEVGPAVTIDEDQTWRLNLRGGLKGGGGIVTRMRRKRVESDVDDMLVVTASGMPEIRHRFREMAMAIEEGHAQAGRYLENCLSNLNQRTADGLPDPRVDQILASFFGQKKPDIGLRDAVSHAVTVIYEALMSPSLSPLDSQRYVVGVNRMGDESISAFVFGTDPAKRIFITEHFFRLPVYRLKIKAIRSGVFSLGPHYRAAILIHEVSHLALNTDDIAYVDSEAPFLDVLEDTAGYRLRIKNEQIARQQKALSYDTDRSQLFKQLEEDGWHDLRRVDGDGKTTILRITGKKSLEEARDVFYANERKRSEIILSNADSVALLVTLLGRERFS